MLLNMGRFLGWEASVAWEDLKIHVNHHAPIERVAMVREKGGSM
jgi:hypothetical protein